mgnify:FL=1
MKRILKCLCISLILFGCTTESEEKNVSKVVEDFYIYLNKKDFESIKKISTKEVDRYIDFVSTIGDDLVQVKTIDINEVKIENHLAKVDVKTIDIYGNVNNYKWSLIKEHNSWHLMELEEHGIGHNLTEDDIEYTKKAYPKKVDSIGSDSI